MTAAPQSFQQTAETLRQHDADVVRLADWLLHMQGTFSFLMHDPIIKEHVGFLKRSEDWLRSGASGDVRAAVIEEAANLAEAWEKPSFALVRGGEMTAQELRTVIAVASAIGRSIRALSQSPATGAAGGNDEHPDCASQREHELYFALTLLASAVMARRSEWANWIQGGNWVAPIGGAAWLTHPASPILGAMKRSNRSRALVFMMMRIGARNFVTENWPRSKNNVIASAIASQMKGRFNDSQHKHPFDQGRRCVRVHPPETYQPPE